MNNNSTKTMEEKLTKEVMIQLQEPFLLYKRTGEVKGVLFKEVNDSQRLASKMSALLKDISSNATLESGPSDSGTRVPAVSQPATSPGQNSIIRMLHSAAAKQSPVVVSPKSQPVVPDLPRPRPQGVTAPQQHQQQPPPQILAHSVHTAGNHTAPRPVHPNSQSLTPTTVTSQGAKSSHWSNKTTSISVDYLFKSLSSGNRSPPRAISPQQTSGPPVTGTALTLSEVEQQALAEASERLRQQLGISCGAKEVGDHFNQRKDPAENSLRSLVNSGNNNALSQPVLVTEEDDEDALVLTPNMMPEEPVLSRNSAPEREERGSGTQLAAMNREQLRMALITLLEEDDDFLNQIHEGYIRSLQRRLK